jgi:ketosteroid isomerase-like protein
MSSPLESQVIAVEERLRQAMMHSDVGALDELIAPDLIFTSHMGQVLGKDDDLAFHRSGILRLKELTPSEQHIQLHSGFAVVSVLMHLVGHYDNSPIDQTIRYTRIWSSLPDGVLQIIAGHASAVV